MNISLSVAVMAHRKRQAYIPKLIGRLGVGPDRVVWDRHDSRWETGCRALLRYDPAATHHMVVQDDAVVPRDLIAGVEWMLQSVPARTVVCLYIGRITPYRLALQGFVDSIDDTVSWVTMRTLNWGVAIVVPTEMIRSIAEWGNQHPEVENYDKRISRWCESQDVPIWYPWPSLVDHRQGPSLVHDRRSQSRVAHRFVGADRSALQVDWTGRVVAAPVTENPSYPRYTGGPPVEFESIRYPELDLGNKPGLHGVRFRDGRCTVTRPNAISILQSRWWQRRGIRIATEKDAAPAVAAEDAAEQPTPAVQPADPPPSASLGEQPPETVPQPDAAPGGGAVSHVGGGWWAVTIGGEQVAKVRGEQAARQHLAKLTQPAAGPDTEVAGGDQLD